MTAGLGDCLADTGSGALPLLLVAVLLLGGGVAATAVLRRVLVRRGRAGRGAGRPGVGVLGLVVAVGLTASVLALGGPTSSAMAAGPCEAQPTATPTAPVPDARVGSDQEVTFESAGVTVHGSYRRPVDPGGSIPAAVIVVGTGNVDRNGNGVGIESELYRWIADRLSEQGVASFRYDKLGVGATGLGAYASDPDVLATIGYDTLRVQPARDALSFLAAQPGIDASRLIVVGHSEGGAIALDLDAHPGDGPVPAGLVLFEPSYARLFDVVIAQMTSQLDAAVAAGDVTASDAQVLKAWAAAGVEELRSGAPPYAAPGPPPLPEATGFTAVTQSAVQLAFYEFEPVAMLQSKSYRSQYGKDADEVYSPGLSPGVTVPTLITCGTRDVQTPCGDGTPGSGVVAIADGFAPGVARFVELPGTVHLLRDIGDADVPDVEAQLAYPFSAVAEQAFVEYLQRFE
ncbi:hypothetical protein SCB71_05010 [Herbiconiux sp. KACC 21604]|uniref:alpha/beta fold hydrolase n=1 Tax=unclassified Herbiconiux TaxID=2618217 RepID=UPI00149169C6|nr:alpha/beta hydrolase [Herbiconiux sp. SALV-R1]QJU52709.1 hypothetical protein HL652_02990 [Herbiconiux sp. SALV-R1]WPO87608.1 hypothetical protein SCB71_05010 [Herbiconiux sp. KACC 21604]